MTLQPGQTGQFAFIFGNTGTATWQKGDVVLATCCPVGTSPMSSWASGWVSSTVLANANKDSIAPGAQAIYLFNVKVPAGTPSGSYRLDARLIVAATSAQLDGTVWVQVTVPY